MLRLRSFSKLLVLSLLVASIMMLASADARRAYQTVENQDLSSIIDAPDESAQIVVPVKRAFLSRSEKFAHPSFTKIISEKREQSIPSVPADQFLSSPVDCMLQFEKDNHAGLEGKFVSVSEPPIVELKAPTSQSANTSNQTSGLPIDIAVTAVAIGICCYSLTRRFFTKLTLKT